MSAFNFTNTFATLTADDFYREAYERIGIRGASITSELIRSAETSANMALSSWMGKGPNGWTIKRNLIELVPGQSSYQLPRNITQVINAVGTKPTLIKQDENWIIEINSKEGNVPCYWPASQDKNSISFAFAGSHTVNYIGIILSPDSPPVQLVVESGISRDGVNTVWNYQHTFAPISPENKIIWLTLPNPVTANGIKLSSSPKGAPMSIEALRFATIGNAQNVNSGNDRMLGAISYSDWMALPNKNSQNMPTSYFVDTQLEPIMNLWPVPNEKSLTTFTHILYNAYQYPYSVNNLFSSFNVPQKFFDAIAADLSYRLASKWKSEDPNNLQRLKQDSEQAFALAIQTDSQNYSININPNFEGLRA